MKNFEKQITEAVKRQNQVEIQTYDGNTTIYPTTDQDKWLTKEQKQKQCQIPNNYSALMKSGPINNIFGEVE